MERKLVREKEAQANDCDGTNGKTIGQSVATVLTQRIRATAHLMRNTQRHVVLSEIAPPMIGPSSVARATSAERMEPYFGYLSLGMSSKNTTIEMEKQPAPPMPCRARKTILDKNLINKIHFFPVRIGRVNLTASPYSG